MIGKIGIVPRRFGVTNQIQGFHSGGLQDVQCLVSQFGIYTINDSNGVSSPYDEILWFWPKYPKPCWPWHGPSGRLRGSPTPAARKLAAHKQCSPFLRCRLHCSAMPPGQGSLERERGPTRSAQTRPANSSERPLMWPDGRHPFSYKR